VQQVVGLAAARRGALEQFEIGPAGLRGLERLIVAIVAAEDDDVVVGTGIKSPKSERQVDEESAIAPGVERVPVAADKADLPLGLGLCRSR
jgi:hypothetical protein